MYSDASGGDPDATSPTLRRYHRYLWSKPLPGGESFDLLDDKPGAYLYHKSRLGEFFLGSDAITHSYKHQARKKWLTRQIPAVVQEVFDQGSTMGAYIIFPNKQVNRKNTINQARGVSRFIDDRFDLTLECIRRFYINKSSPLENAISRYDSFFRLFESFEGYVQHFLLDDLLNDRGGIKFYLPFDEFQSPPEFRGIEDYLCYKEKVLDFINARSGRIEKYAQDMEE